VWWPGLHVELSSRAAYRCYVDRHFLPFFGELAMEDVLPSQVQAWVTTATGNGLSARSVVKYHVVLHGILKQAARDRVIVHNPTADTPAPEDRDEPAPDPESRRVQPAPQPHSGPLDSPRAHGFETGMR
jgi:Phage integrase, N-terminal SAM-like domain